MLKVGLLGLGMMGSTHASHYLRHPHARLVAVADRDPQRLAFDEAVLGNLQLEEIDVDLSDVARYAEADDLIAQADVDVVDVCLPTYEHARFAIKALEAGRHVLCEKPMALTVAEADAMLAAADKGDRTLMVAQCIRFWPEYKNLRRLVQEGTCGALLSLNMYRIGGAPGWSRDWYFDAARSGGAILDLHIHDVDYVNYLLGLPDAIQAVGHKHGQRGYDVVHACYSYADGPQVHLHAGWSNAQIPFTMGFEAWFERAFLRFDLHQAPTLQLFDDPDDVNMRPLDVEPENAYYNEIDYFLDCVAHGRLPQQCPPASARDSVALVHREIAAIEER
ncbi:MAG: Gfo/Idh/MocA family protein [Anaerolineae bacterium]